MEVDGEAGDGITHQLLGCPSPQSMQRYYENLAASGVGPGLQVRQIGGEMGKGVFADRDFKAEELVLRETKLVGAQHSRNKVDALVCSNCFRYVGSIELQLARRLLYKNGDSLDEGNEGEENMDAVEEGADHMEEDDNRDGADHMHEDKRKGNSKQKKALPPEAKAALASGTLQLPYSNQFLSSPIVNCKGGCSDDVYCSDMCAESAWQAHHSLLCSGPLSFCKNIDALTNFKEFADETNDIFHIAAQVIASTILRARMFESSLKGKPESTLLRAWEPFAMGHKLLWWETVALPVDVDPSDEPDFRIQMKEIAFQSLSLLKEAIYEECFDSLFSLQVYGHIIGMFELNNLEIVVASPVEDYFLYIDELPPADKEKSEMMTKPFLDALGDDYAAYCQGSGFYALQSCVNHSCWPNAKAFKRDEDRDGHAVLLATRSIRKGEEITISYIDEDCSMEERRALLADYQFVCRCARCREESRTHSHKME